MTFNQPQILDYVNNLAANLNYQGSFTNSFNKSNYLTLDAMGKAENAKIYSKLHRDYSNLIEYNVKAFNLCSDIAALAGIIPLAAKLREFAIGGKFWSFGQLANSFSIAFEGFDENKTRLKPAVSAAYSNMGGNPIMDGSFPTFASFP